MKKKIQWYAADMADTSIIAYGTITDSPKPTDSKKGRRDYKITWKRGIYYPYQRSGKGNAFEHFGETYTTLEGAQYACQVRLDIVISRRLNPPKI